MQRVWGDEGYADADSPRAWWRVWATAVGTENIPDPRTVVRWQRDGFALPTEVGSNGWRGFEMLSPTGYVTHPTSVVAGLTTHWAAVTTSADAARGEKMRAAKRARGPAMPIWCDAVDDVHADVPPPLDLTPFVRRDPK